MKRSEWMAPVPIAGREVPYALVLILGALIYFGLAELGLTFAHLQESASPVWPASGFAVALLSVGGRRLLPAVLAGAFAANTLVGGPLTALPISLGNALEALAGYWLIRRIGTLNPDLFPWPQSAAFASAAILAAAVSAAIGVATLALAGAIGDAAPSQVAFTWWTGDALGILLLTPPLLLLARRGKEPRRQQRGQVATTVLLILAAPALSGIAFLASGYEAAVFLALPPTLAALRRGGHVAGTLAILATAALWLAFAGSGMGPFTSADPNAAILETQIMLAAFAVATMIFSEMKQVDSVVPTAIFVIGCLLTGAVYHGLRENLHEIDRRHLVNVSNRIQQHIQERMNTYANALRGAASLYAAARDVSALEWQRYVQSLDLDLRYPGILGIGVALPTDKASASGFIHAMRREFRPDFAIKPVPGVTAEDAAFPQHFVIVFIEPAAPNEAAIGLDLASEPRRRQAALMARDTGNASITARITLVQDDRREPGFLLFVPMYREPAGSSEPEMLRWYFHGWVYFPFTAHAFFDAARIAESGDIRLRIYDGPNPNPVELIYDSGGDPAAPFRASRRTQLPLFGRDFTMEWQETALFDHQSPLLPVSLSAFLVLFLGMIAAFIATMLSQKDRAIRFADRMSAELSMANERFELAVDCSQDVIWDEDLVADRSWASPRLPEMFGYGAADVADGNWPFWRKVIEPEDFARLRTQYDQLVSGARDGFDLVLRARNRAGEPMHVQTRAKSVSNVDGKVVRVIGVDTDITLVKQLETRLRAAIGVMVDGFGLFDAEDRLILYNDGFIDDGTRKVIGDPTGCTFEEILRAFAYHDMPVVDPGFDREAWIAQRLERHRNPPDEPLEVVWGDGRVMRISERRTADGGYVGIWTDVTAIRIAEQRLRLAIDSMKDGFALFDRDDRLLICNDGFLSGALKDLIGDPTGMTFEEIYRVFVYQDSRIPTDLDREAWLQQRLALHRNPPDEGIEFQGSDGRWTRITERRTPEGSTVGTWTDVTAIRTAEQRLKDAIESINEGFLLLDAEGRYVVFNSQLLKLYPKTAPHVRTGGSFAEALRKGAEAGEYPHLETPDRIDAFVAEWTARFRDPTPFQGAAPLAGGGWVLVSHRPTGDGGSVNIYTDITALKARESDLAEANVQLQRQAQALTVLTEELRAANLAAHQANISMSQFLANMSHELRTPLNGILGFADIIRSQLFGEITPARYRDYAEDIHRSGEHLLNLINDILDLSKIEAGKMSLRVEAIASEEAVAQALRMVQPLAESRKVTLRPPVIENCPILHADERQLKQILLNLLSNAVKFTPESGSIAIGIRRDGERGAMITIEDTGVGMTPQEVRTALERFGQADSSLAKSTPGTGLGLPLVDGLVKLHDGRLEIASEKGKGTTVTVFLPWRDDLPVD
ncbi:MAG: PAS-domain containing protein [Rhodospirillaceae bacterium]|nr:PAS-domain containing protein [Rhodospirillaceae bacterium]